ncbi:MAG: hypothetical protein D6733_07315 [Methanobacteriota archaeon]|nr:MAG: hypothetical protein D6733_07315 [Euryarchaeota archaeon]
MLIAKSKSESEVNKALEILIKEVNEELEKVDGLISKIDCDVSVGPFEASVSASVFIDGVEPRRKFLIGVNEKGYNRESSMKKVERRINRLLENSNGRIADSYIKIISSLPGRVYTTAILAVNEEVLEEANDVEVRRKRLKKCLELLGNDPSAINVARVAALFGVSRTMIYKDLEALGYKRD